MCDESKVLYVYLQGGVLQVRTVNSAKDPDLVCALVIPIPSNPTGAKNV